MSPLKIQIMLHYYALADDFRNGDFSAPAVIEALETFVRQGMLRATAFGRQRGEPAYKITDKGRAYVEALKAVPLPVSRWVIPTVKGDVLISAKGENIIDVIGIDFVERGDKTVRVFGKMMPDGTLVITELEEDDDS